MPFRPPPPLDSGRLRPAVGNETYVYRAYCKCGDLLYVGITGDLAARLTTHRRTRSRWEIKAVRIEWDLYPTRVLAAQMEDYLIRTLHPIHNVYGRSNVGRIPRWVPLPPIQRGPTLGERYDKIAARMFAGI